MTKDIRIHLLYRVEPGCLGPDGATFVEAFCEFAKKKIPPPNYAVFDFVPRYDKSLPEKEYAVVGKNITQGQAQSYFDKLDKDIDEFEEQVDELLSFAIDAFFKR